MKQTAKTKKTALISFLIVLVILIVSVVGISVAGILKGANTDDGIVAFAKDTVNLVILRKDIREYVSYDDLMADLKENGFEDILFPKEISSNSDKYKFTVPRYSNIGIEQVGFDIYFDEGDYFYIIAKQENLEEESTFVGLENAETITVNGIDFYVFDYGNFVSSKFHHDGFNYDVGSSYTYDDVIKLLKSIK